MSQTAKQVVGPHRISVRNKSPGQMLTGANAEIYMDDERLRGVTFFKLEIKPKGIAKITLELIVDAADIQVDSHLEQKDEASSNRNGSYGNLSVQAFQSVAKDN